VSRRALALACAAVAIAFGVGSEATAGAAVTQVPAQWDVLGVGPGARSLRLVYLVGGCESGPPTVAAAETAASVTVTVTVQDNQSPGIACPADLGYATTSVALSAPLGGRAILGRPATPVGFYPGGLLNVHGRLELSVPRLLGMAPADARRTLDLYGLQERAHAGPRRGGLRRVVAQRPRAGTRVRPDAGVRVAFSRARR
jgi:PASTA domain